MCRILAGMTAAARVAAHEPLLIYVSRDSQGVTFGIDLPSRERLRAALPANMHVWPLVFIAHEKRGEFEQLPTALLEQVVTLLTGLSPEQARKFDGIEFMDPEREERLAFWPPVHP